MCEDIKNILSGRIIFESRMISQIEFADSPKPKEGFEEPDFKVLEGFFDKEDECDEKIGRINREISALRKSGKKDEIKTLKKEIESLAKERKEAVLPLSRRLIPPQKIP